MLRSKYMLLTFGLLIFCFRDASSIEVYARKCTYIPTIGPCMTPSARYFFNPVQGACMMFSYSGCGGNDNNFLTLSECQRECRSLVPEKCTYDIVIGPCMSPVGRYFFSPVVGTCLAFYYGGCGGNANNFETFEECMRECQPTG